MITGRAAFDSAAALAVACPLLLLSACFAEAPDDGARRQPAAEGGESAATLRVGGGVAILTPFHGEDVINPVTFRVATAPGIHRVALDADGWLLDEWDPHHHADAVYTFNGVGTPRVITLTGFDGAGTPVATDRVTITVWDDFPGNDGTVGAASVRIDAPADGSTVHNPVTFDVSGHGVDAVKLFADGYAISDFWQLAWGSTHTYTFSGTGLRNIELVGYDSHWNRIALDEISIAVEGVTDPGNGDGGNPNPSGSLNVPYYYQYDNAYEPGATCGLTSAAMLLSYLHGAAVDPDTLYTAYGKAQGQSPGALEQLYGWEGLYGRSTYGGTRAMIKDQLDAGRPVLVHTYLTGAGHIVAIVGYDGSGWIVNDPAGDWYQCYGCGVMGDHVLYGYGGGADDAMSWDGDIWLSTADTHPFSL